MIKLPPKTEAVLKKYRNIAYYLKPRDGIMDGLLMSGPHNISATFYGIESLIGYMKENNIWTDDVALELMPYALSSDYNYM